MKNKRVLLISYYFPPLGGAGISRPLSLFKHIGAFGYDCDVLTVKPVVYRVYEPELIAELDQSKIFRSGSRDPSRLMYLLGMRKISIGAADHSQKISKHFFPDSKAGWISSTIRTAESLCRKNEYDLIVSTSPPVSAHVIAMKTSLKSNIPWVADFQDFWVLKKAEEYFVSDVHKNKAKELLSQIKASSKSIVANNQSVADYVGADTVISNSFESELVKLWRPPLSREDFVIGLFGSLGDLNPIAPMLEVLTIIKEINRNLYDKTKVLQVGQVDKNWLTEQLVRQGHKDKFEFMGFQDRKKAVQILSESALFYFGLAAEIGSGVIPIRLYTLLASGRPILVFAPPGSEVDNLLTGTGSGFSFDKNGFEEAAQFVIERAEKYETDITSFTEIPEYAQQFSSDKMVERFARLFDRLLNS